MRKNKSIEKSTRRIAWIDEAKGIGIFFVMLGHCYLNGKFTFWFYSFHMALFFFLSGYTFSLKEQKYNEFSKNLAFRTQSADMQHILLQLNIADDYMKCREELAIQTRKLEEAELERKQLQNSLVTMQVKYDNLEASMKLVEKKYQDAKAKIY